MAALALPGCAPAGDSFFVCSQQFEALGRAESYAIHVPQAAARGGILFLHGAGRDHLTLLHDPAARAAIARTNAVVLLPRGGNSWWVGPYRNYLLELMGCVGRALGIERWAAAGWSMGGYGSLALVVRRPEMFRAWGGLVALADFPNEAYPPQQNHSVPPVFGSRERWPEWNPMAGVARLRGKHIWFGTGASAFDRGMNETLDSRLKALDIPHEFRIVPGGHELRVVVALLDSLLQSLAAGLQ